MINIDYKKHINHIYSYPFIDKDAVGGFANIAPINNIYFYSFARYALYYGLKYYGVKKEDKVLLPSFICREFLSAINSIGATPVFYHVDKNLNPINLPNKDYDCKAIIAVNYFGFPQDLEPFEEFCKKTDSILIEDNAHGFLSYDEFGRLLGTRANIGIFSFRKTIPMNYGAGLYIDKKINRDDFPYSILPEDHNNMYLLLRSLFRKFFPIIGVSGIKLFTYAIRRIRKIRTGKYFPESDKSAETILPFIKSPPLNLMNKLDHLKIKEESNRRRELYLWLHNLIVESGGEPVFDELINGCVPYGFPFYVASSVKDNIENRLLSSGLESFPWPDLPQGLKVYPEHYNKLRCVRFLW